jgi:hypothetical protein
MDIMHIRESFHCLLLGGIYTHLNSSVFLLIRSLLTTVCSGGSALGERRERLFPRNPVLLQLLVLLLVLLVCLLLVLCDQVVKVGTALAGRDVEWRSSVEDPVDIMLAHISSPLLCFIPACEPCVSSLQQPPPSFLLLQAQGGNILREPQVNMTDSLTGLVQEQHSVRSSLLNHFCVNIVAIRPCVGVFVVGVGNQAREVGLLVAGSGPVEAEESDGHGGDRNEETRLHPQLVIAFFTSSRAIAVLSQGRTYAEALSAGGGVVSVASAVAGVTALDLGSYTTRGAQGCSLKGKHGVCASQWAYVLLVYRLLVAR